MNIINKDFCLVPGDDYRLADGTAVEISGISLDAAAFVSAELRIVSGGSVIMTHTGTFSGGTVTFELSYVQTGPLAPFIGADCQFTVRLVRSGGSRVTVARGRVEILDMLGA